MEFYSKLKDITRLIIIYLLFCSVTKSFIFHNYEIPQGAHILCNAYAMQHDPQYFKEPMKYDPERFLNSDGTVRLNNIDAYGPFSFGK